VRKIARRKFEGKHAETPRALGPNRIVLMRRHGATVPGTTIEELVFRSVFSCRNAEMQREAQMLGGVSSLTPVEIAKADAFNLEPRPIGRESIGQKVAIGGAIRW
jgi:ribulose-5-phosphate 4-epimerase/fuculose-1-phosphate aldolase